MAVKTKGMKPRLHTDFEIRGLRTMTLHAGSMTLVISVIVMASQAIDLGVFFMRKIQQQALGLNMVRLTQG